MKKHLLKRQLSLLLAAITVFSSGSLVFADEVEDVEEIPLNAEILDESDVEEATPVDEETTSVDEEAPVEIEIENVEENEEIVIEEVITEETAIIEEDVEVVEADEEIVDEIVVEDEDITFEAAEVTNGWVQDGAYWYYYKNGQKVRGWQKIGKYWYFFDNNNYRDHYMWANKKASIDGKYYIFSSNGVMQTGWVYYYGDWYYCGSSGVVRSGWQKIGRNWYFFDTDSYDYGEMAVGRWGIDGYYYYFNKSGVMQKNKWIQAGNNTWYYAVSSGRLVTDRWMKIGGYWYYFKYNSAIVVNTSWYIDNKTYRFDRSGHCTNP